MSQAMQKMKKAQKELDKLKDEKVSEKEKELLQRLEKTQEKNREDLEKLMKKMEELQKLQEQTEDLDQAKSKMQQAAQEMSLEDVEEAIERAKEATKNMKKAEKKLAEEEARYANQRQEELLFHLKEALKKMVASQTKINGTTLDIHQQRIKGLTDEEKKAGLPYARITKAQSNELLGLAEEQKKLGDEAQKVSAILEKEGSTVYTYHLNSIREDMDLVIKCLGQERTDPTLQDIQSEILANLEKLLNALNTELQKRQEEEKGEKQQGEGKKAILPKLAELKMLRDMQADIRNRTQQISETAKGKTEMDPLELELLRRIANKQGNILDITKKFTDLLKKQQ